MIVHGRFSGFLPGNRIAADILRIEDGLLMERADVIQDEATRRGVQEQSADVRDEFSEIPQPQTAMTNLPELALTGDVSRHQHGPVGSGQVGAGSSRFVPVVLTPKGLQRDPPEAAASSQFQGDVPPWVIWRM